MAISIMVSLASTKK